ncbi:Alanyl-tRNA synthetase family protein [Labilithrix luteola]|uniref:Alanine--tRNA ligase n=1 Tax=Labilithrix luteola TaxID=1391654 RepID=A0A0K1PS01_9BACT|nr:DHHA1 domain-containing protein [Labilithrix luteola]AKU96315.1 Alanyl-tRNA synthetase family protein [Labilithrix luteola]
MACFVRRMTTMTEKLYWSDPFATTFEAEGLTLSAFEGRPSVVLAKTLFYPEGGGQLGDAGTIVVGGVNLAVADTQVDDAGVIHHVLAEAPVPELEELARGAATAVRGTIDDRRRRDHMAIHTAQHALSRAVADEASATTVSSRLGASICTIDVSRPSLADADLARAEDLVNAVVMNDVPVHAQFPTPEELASMDLRKQPNMAKAAAGVRVITIEGFDITPCGGTHCTRTGQIGQVRIVGTEKYKGMLRISFHAGRRALVDARARHDVLSTLASSLTCGVFDVPQAVTKLRTDLKGLRTELDAARAELAALFAKEILSTVPTGTPHVIAVARPADDLASLRTLAGKLAESPDLVVIVTGTDAASGDLVLVVQRGGSSKFDCGAFVQSQAKAQGGRGGGRPERAEGRFPSATSLDALASAAKLALADSATQLR